MDMSNIFSPISAELNTVESQLTQNLDSYVEILNHASHHLVNAGGKRLRPGFTLLAGKLYRDCLDEIIPAAVALELIHLASLVHDDVIDNSDTRRGTETVKCGWGNRISIYTGNFILARALALVAQYERCDIVDVIADASMKICEGEFIQMQSCYNVNLGLKNFLRRIERKTALLISVSCQLGAMLCCAPGIETNALQKYGYYLGMAFQVTDDILDFIADEKVLGKPTGSDIKQGVITLPALYALKHAPDRQELADLLSSPELCNTYADRIIDIILDSDGIDYAYFASRYFAQKAKNQLRYFPEREVKKAFLDTADFILERDF